jgi:hypothetical protein
MQCRRFIIRILAESEKEPELDADPASDTTLMLSLKVYKINALTVNE